MSRQRSCSPGDPLYQCRGQSVFIGNHDDRGVAETRLDRMVSAQYVRLLPHDFQHGIYLRLEIMGCTDGICSSPLGLEDGRIHYGQLTSSTHRENNPADAGRLNIPGWSPLPTDPQPYFQVDFLEPTWVSGVVTQGSERTWGYLTKYRLAFSLHGNVTLLFHVCSFVPVTRWLGQLLRARYLRLIPVEFRHTFYLRAEILGCRGGEVIP
uniref:F5/8 type C domain-containing protein n=1 Tax=Periophthalmus magnuspinnatus TaxID=409849 RepID=A0A3B4BFL7_9GOBI